MKRKRRGREKRGIGRRGKLPELKDEGDGFVRRMQIRVIFHQLLSDQKDVSVL